VLRFWQICVTVESLLRNVIKIFEFAILGINEWLVFHRPQLWSKEPFIYRSIPQTFHICGLRNRSIYSWFFGLQLWSVEQIYIYNWFDRPNLWSVEYQPKLIMNIWLSLWSLRIPDQDSYHNCKVLILTS
jgi:hypothetical protein